MAYDPFRNRVVMFGGYDGQSLLNDTWEFDGRLWRKLSAAGPSPRGGASMCFDENLGACLLFGGSSTSGALNDTWMWNGRAWAQIALSSAQRPKARFDANLVYDDRLGRSLLFCGHDQALAWGSALFHDSWQFDGENWKALPDGGLIGNSNCAGVYDSARGVVFTYGPQTEAQFGAVGEFDGNQWTYRYKGGPQQPPNGSGCCYDSVRETTVLCALPNQGNSTNLETWEYRIIDDLPTVTVSAPSIYSGTEGSLDIRLAKPAPRIGQLVKLTTSSGLVSCVPSAFIDGPTQATTIPFSVGTVSIPTKARLFATCGTHTASVNVTILPAALISFELAPSTVKGAHSSIATIKWTGTPPDGSLVSLTSNSSHAIVPATVAAVGQSSTFAVRTTSVTSTTTVQIQAVLGSSRTDATLTITP